MKRTAREIELMRAGGKILASILDAIEQRAIPGANPQELDQWAATEAKEKNALPAFLGFQGYPASLCVSRGCEVVHGIPNDKPFVEGELVSFDFGILYQGLYTDAARTVIIGGSGEAQKVKLLRVAKSAFDAACDVIRDGVRVGDIGNAVQTYVEERGFSVVRALVGHGVGTSLHEDPSIPNYGSKHTGSVLHEGMTVAIEPMIAAGKYDVETLADGWTVVTRDRSLAAHYEETLLITKDGYEILTQT